MTSKNATPPDLTQVVDGLDADAIAARLDALERESAALRVLYKAARARDRRRRAAKIVADKEKEAARAS